MNKKFLSLVLALVMVLGTFGNVFAAAATDKKDVKDVPKLTSTDAKVQWLIDNEIVIGTADKDGKATGNKDLTNPIRRDAAAKMLVYAVGAQDLAAKLQGVYRPFPDVETTNIMNGLIAAAASSNNANGVAIITGYEDGLFRPTKNVTYAELAKMLVVAIDKDLTPAKAKTYSWPQGWLDRAAQLGIFDGLSIDKANDAAVRRDAFAMIYNAFYKLKELKAVPMNETRGIISKHFALDKDKKGTLVLNQGDFKKEFKITKDTNFVDLNGVKANQRWISKAGVEENKYFVGSLVRVLSDKDGVATHVIEIGNPINGVQNGDYGWVDLGNATFKKAQSWKNSITSATEVKDIKGLDNPVNVDFANAKVTFANALEGQLADKVSYDITSKTAIYVADYGVDKLTQVKDLDALKAIFDKNNDKARVYVGYEVLPKSGVKEAKVIVFNYIADAEDNAQVVRVAKGVSNEKYTVLYNKPGEKETQTLEFNTKDLKGVWPFHAGVNNFDVFALINEGKDFKVNTALIIDYKNDPIVEIDKFLMVNGADEKEVSSLREANAVVLKDADGAVATFDIPTEFNKFYGDQIVKGAHVQYALRNSNKTIDVLSVLPNGERLRGDVFGGIDASLKTGYVVAKYPARQATELDRVLIRPVGKTKAVEYVTTDASKFDVDTYVDYKVSEFNRTYTRAEVYLVAKNNEALNKEVKGFKDAVDNATKKTDYPSKDVKAIQRELYSLIEKHNKLSKAAKGEADVTAAVTDLKAKIAAYNALDGADKIDDSIIK